MTPLAANKPSKNSNSGCADLATMAEHELSAFFSAVTKLFGSEQAALSAEDWLHELINIDDLPASTREWRLITAKASTRLASRVNGSSLSTESQSTESQTIRRKGICVFLSQAPQAS
jgi:hypothetical protein